MSFKKIVIYLAVIYVSFLSGALAMDGKEAANIYNQAGALYKEARFEEALSMYESLIDAGIKNPDLFYNASNAAYRAKNIGKSLLYIERAAKIAPSDEDIISNRAFLNSIKLDREPVNSNPVAEYIYRAYDKINVNSAAVLSGILFFFAVLSAIGILFLPGWPRRVFIIATSVFFAISLLYTGIMIEKIHASGSKEAIIMSKEVNSYSGPGTENTHIFTIHEGTKVYIERSQEDWDLIRLKNGAGGWIKSEDMKRI